MTRSSSGWRSHWTTAASNGRSSAIACSASLVITWLTGKVANLSSVGWTTPRSSRPKPPCAGCGPNTTEPSKRGRQTWQYKLIAAEAARIGWPALYAEDLTNHDAYTLGTRQPAAFLWMLRECGTWLHTDDTGAEWLQAEVKQSGDRAHYYHVTHAGLRTLTPEKFAAFRFAS